MRSRTKQALAHMANAVLRPLAPLLVRRGPASGLPARPRVLVVRCDHIGDAVMATSVLRPLRAALNPSRLDLLVGPWAEHLFRDHPLVDGVVVYGTPWWRAARHEGFRARTGAWFCLPRVIRTLRANRYDVAIDLRGDLRHIVFFLALGGARVRVSSERTAGTALLTHWCPHLDGRHEVERNAAIVALLGAHGPLRLEPPTLEDLPCELVDLLPGAPGLPRYAAVALRGTEPNRAWPVPSAASLAEGLHERFGLATVIVGGPADREAGDLIAAASRVPVVNLAGQTTLRQAVSVLARSRVAVTVDSGPMHLAALAGVPVAALFGPGDPAECRPWCLRYRVVTTGAPCGCVHPWCDHAEGPGRCMTQLAPDRVLDAVAELLAPDEVAGPAAGLA